MNLKVIVAATAMPVLATVAYAQTAPTTPSTTTPSAADTPSTTTPSTPAPSATDTPSTTTPSATAPSSTTAAAGTAPVWYSHQQGELRSTKLVGSKVKNNAGDTIGDINDIILSSDGSATAAVIGVGGFLGMGEHQVAVEFTSLKISQDSNGNDVVMLDTTKDALKNAPQWTWQSS